MNKDKEIIEQIIKVLQLPGEEITDGESIDEIIEIIQSQYQIVFPRD
jgi:hypothetical protein